MSDCACILDGGRCITIKISGMCEDGCGNGGSGNGGSGNGNGNGSASDDSLVYLGAFHNFYEKTPPKGWMVRNGAQICSNVIPELEEALKLPENAWKVLSEDEWQAMSQAEPWKGIGGVPYFSIDSVGGFIRLPDTRGMYAEDAGYDDLEVGDVHGDAIRNLTGMLSGSQTNAAASFREPTGVFGILHKPTHGTAINSLGIGTAMNSMDFDASRSVPVANKNQPRAFGSLPCVYVGKRDGE